MMENKHKGPRKGYKHHYKTGEGRTTQKRRFKKKQNPLVVPAVILIGVVSIVLFASVTNFGQVITEDTNTNTSNNITGDFILQDTYSFSEFKMSDYKGSLILIDFMAIGCVYCPYSYPELERVTDTYPQVEIFTVTIDPSDTVDEMNDYSRDYAISWHVARDIYSVSSSKFSVTGTPTTVLIDRDFNVVEQQAGVLSFEIMQEWIDSHL